MAALVLPLVVPVISTMMGRHLLLRSATAQTAEGLVLLRWSTAIAAEPSAGVVGAYGFRWLFDDAVCTHFQELAVLHLSPRSGNAVYNSLCPTSSCHNIS